MSDRILRPFAEHLNQVHDGEAQSEMDKERLFVLVRGLRGVGFLHGRETLSQHFDIQDELWAALRNRFPDEPQFPAEGGGRLRIRRHEGEKTHLVFHGSGRSLGKFNKELLEKTLRDSLDQRKFTWTIS